MSTDTPVDELFSHFPELVPADALVQLSPKLARWIRQMLSVNPEPRGTTAELAVGLALAADTEGLAADQPIIQRMIRGQGTPETQIISTPSADLPWHTWFKTTLMGALIIAGVGSLLHAVLEPLPSAYASEHAAAQAPAPQSDTSGLGELPSQSP